MRTALETIELFWKTQDDRDYSRLSELFADDAVLVDPIYGTYEGREAIAAFMEKMNAEMGGQQIEFDLVEAAGDGEVAWAQWQARTPAGVRQGVGIYRVRDGLLTYYKDYMNPLGEG